MFHMVLFASPQPCRTIVVLATDYSDVRGHLIYLIIAFHQIRFTVPVCFQIYLKLLFVLSRIDHKNPKDS